MKKEPKYFTSLDLVDQVFDQLIHGDAHTPHRFWNRTFKLKGEELSEKSAEYWVISQHPPSQAKRYFSEEMLLREADAQVSEIDITVMDYCIGLGGDDHTTRVIYTDGIFWSVPEKCYYKMSPEVMSMSWRKDKHTEAPIVFSRHNHVFQGQARDDFDYKDLDGNILILINPGKLKEDENT